jgi:hypothetical protein
MTGILYMLTAAAVGLICMVTLVQATRTGLVSVEDATYEANQNPIPFFVMIVLNSACLGFCIAYVLFSLGYGDDPVQVLRHALGLAG